jgi:flagellar biosynthesis/type III secretory pathway M-ring protein FliF/YscJ
MDEKLVLYRKRQRSILPQLMKKTTTVFIAIVVVVVVVVHLLLLAVTVGRGRVLVKLEPPQMIKICFYVMPF